MKTYKVFVERVTRGGPQCNVTDKSVKARGLKIASLIEVELQKVL